MTLPKDHPHEFKTAADHYPNWLRCRNCGLKGKKKEGVIIVQKGDPRIEECNSELTPFSMHNRLKNPKKFNKLKNSK